MRSSIAVVLALVLLLAGFWGLSTASESVEGTITENNTATAKDLADRAFEDLGGGLASAVPWAGVAAIVIIALGMLVGSAGGGR